MTINSENNIKLIPYKEVARKKSFRLLLHK